MLGEGENGGNDETTDQEIELLLCKIQKIFPVKNMTAD